MRSICYESSKKCNLNCEYCITSDNMQAATSDNFIDIIHFIAKVQPERIVISGGEPLLDEFLIDKLTLIHELCSHSCVSLSTNGSIDYDLMTIKQYADSIDISIPTLDKQLYAAMRGTDCVDQVKKTVQTALSLGFNVRISFMLSNINKHSLTDVLEYADSVGVNSVRIGRFLPFRCAAKLRNKYELPEDEIDGIMKDVFSRGYGFDIVPPVKDLSSMETGYVTVNYLGEVFFPTEEGKILCGSLDSIEQVTIKSIEDTQRSLFTKMQTKDSYIYSKYFSIERIRKSPENRTPLDEYYSDRTRIMYFSLFRKLQQKAQVFSLESNSSVRSRLTHSLEVSDIGRRLAIRVAECLTELDSSYKLCKDDTAKLVAVVENACLLHDIGNPPFGHFGESAIKEWWSSNNEGYMAEYRIRAEKRSEVQLDFYPAKNKNLLADFSEFDGNPQGIRAILRLNDGDTEDSEDRNDDMESGLNLTAATILCALKYSRCTGEVDERTKRLCHSDIIEKPGYYRSEERIIKRVYKNTGLRGKGRYPFTYILEAADDIAYCISDISDGIEKGVITGNEFVTEFTRCWNEDHNEDVPETVLKKDKANKLLDNRVDDFSVEIGSNWKDLIIREIVDRFVGSIGEYMGGYAAPIITKNSESGKLLRIIKDISNRIIYRSPEAEVMEMAGYSIISGLLNYFGKLLRLTMGEFSYLTKTEKDKENDKQKKKLALEWRIFNRFPKRYVNSYKNQLKEWEPYYGEYGGKQNIEWWLRTHLIIDYITGMTDDSALQTYQVCNGIDIKLF